MSSCTRLVEPGRLDLHPAGEAGDRLGVVGGVHDGLGEQGERADGGLELVADVRHEVAPYRFDTAGLGEVLDQEQDETGPERCDPRGDREGLAPARTAPGEIQLHLPYLAVATGVARHVQHRLDSELAAPDKTQRVRGGAGLDDGVALVEHDRGGAQHGEDRVDPRGQYGIRVQ